MLLRMLFADLFADMRDARAAAGLAAIALALALAAPALASGLPDGEASDTTGASWPKPLNKAWAAEGSRDLAVGQHRWGLAFRARYLDIENVVPLGVSPDQTLGALRLRTQVSLDYRRSRAVRIFGKLTNEATTYRGCEVCDGGVGEVIFENLYVEAFRPWDLPLAVRAGRQDLFYGDGFLIADGGPLDESRTSYVNGVVVTSAIPLWSFDAFWVRDPARDNYLPRINNAYTLLIEGDEIVWGIFAARRPAPGSSLRYSFEPYYIYKRESWAGRAAKFHTVGARLGANLGIVQAIAEAAYQGGKIPEPAGDNDPLDLLSGPETISAAGGHVRLEAHLGTPVPVGLTGGYVVLTGDEIGTRNKYEGWNPVLGRWPLWSDVFTYALAGDATAPPMYPTLAYWQNLAAPFFKLTCTPIEAVTFEVKYLWLDALEDRATQEKIARPDIENPKHRGEIYGARVSWRLASFLDGHVLFERFRPGAFYAPLETDAGVPDDATYLRVEITRSF
jgi:hypothetical protein